MAFLDTLDAMEERLPSGHTVYEAKAELANSKSVPTRGATRALGVARPLVAQPRPSQPDCRRAVPDPAATQRPGCGGIQIPGVSSIRQPLPRSSTAELYLAYPRGISCEQKGDPVTETIYTIPEVACYLKLSRSKIYCLVQQGKIPHVRFGKNVRITERDLNAWLDTNSTGRRQPPLQ